MSTSWIIIIGQGTRLVLWRACISLGSQDSFSTVKNVLVSEHWSRGQS